MIIYNKTNTIVRYDISAPGAGDCGTIAPNGHKPLPAYDQYESVRVTLAPQEPRYFEIGAPGNGTVTLSLTAE